MKKVRSDVSDDVTVDLAISPDGDISVLEDHGDDPVAEEIMSLINDLSTDEQVDLVAMIAWLGRSDYTAADWPEVRAEAARAHNQNTANYLLGMPLLGDDLKGGLSMLGRDREEYEIGRL